METAFERVPLVMLGLYPLDRKIHVKTSPLREKMTWQFGAIKWDPK